MVVVGGEQKGSGFIQCFAQPTPSSHSPLLYQSPSRRSPGDDDGAVLPDSDPTIADALAAGVAALLEGDTSPSSPTPPPPPALAAALASALCIAARECPPVVEAEEVAGGAPAAPVARRAPPPRILILAAAAAAAAGDAYVPVMNAVFAAQKLGVPIDVALLGGAHGAGVLAPAPHLTHGVLHTPRDRGALITHLISIFAPSVATRASLALPRATGGVDLGASCFCHASRVDIGHVCSVCLSIWCEPVDACATCGSSFTVGPGAGSKRAAGNG